MAESALAPASATPAKAPKKRAATRLKKSGPSVGKLIVKAMLDSKERSGVSLAALKKALAATGYNVEKNNSCVKVVVKSLVTKGTLVQTKGTGSFMVNKKQTETKKKPVKKVAPKAKKPVAKKPKKRAAPKKAAKSPKKTKTVKPKALKAKKAAPTKK